MSEQNNQPNPYNNRNHESSGHMDHDDIRAVAGLLGQVSGSLEKIDQQNVGGANPYIKAKKLDPKQVLKQMVTPDTVQHVPPQPQASQVPVNAVPQPVAPSPVVPVNTQVVHTNNDSLEKRITQLEKVIESYKKITKFKRGISYTINTAKISGEFKDPIDIIDIVTTELAKQTKSITLKLNDNTKN